MEQQMPPVAPLSGGKEEPGAAENMFARQQGAAVHGAPAAAIPALPLHKLITSYFEANRQTDSPLLLSLMSDSIVAVYPSAILKGKAAYAAHIKKTFTWSQCLFAHQAVWPQEIVIDEGVGKAMVKWSFDWKLKGLCGLVAGHKEGYNVFHFEGVAEQARIKFVRTDVLAGRGRTAEDGQ